MKFNRKRAYAALASIGILAGTATVATASIPDSDDGEFHVCVQTNRSVNTLYTMFVMDPSLQTNFNGHCNTGYTEHTLNQQGPKGDTGDTGPRGPAGPAASAPRLTGVRHWVPQGSGQDVVVLSEDGGLDNVDGEFNVLSAGVITTDFAPAGPDAIRGSAPFGYTSHNHTSWRMQFQRDPNQDYLVEINVLYQEVNP